MFNQIRLVSIPKTLAPKLNVAYKFVFGSLGVMFVGMLLSGFWQWLFNVKASSALEAPLPIQALILGGLAAFLLSLVVTLFVLPVLDLGVQRLRSMRTVRAFKTCRTCDDEARCKRLQICGWLE